MDRRLSLSLALLLCGAAACAPTDIDGVVATDAGRRDTGRADTGRSDVAPIDATGNPDGGGTDVTPGSDGSTPSEDSGGGTTDAGADAGPADSGPPRCGAGIDSDMDGVNNDVECAEGTDPFDADTDDDGVPDGAERDYPRVCVSPMQRRPPQQCMTDANCMAGEVCAGLDPRRRDSDGDGVDDGIEDPNYDGRIDTARGETDPRLSDTDGDGRGDAMGGVAICRPSGLATVTQLGLPGAGVQAGYDPRWGTARRVTGTMMRSGVVMEEAATNVAGGVFNVPSMGDVRAEAMRVETTVTMALGAGTTPVLVGRAFTTHEMHEAVQSTYRVAQTNYASVLRDRVAGLLLGASATAGPAVGMSTEFIVDVTTVRRGGTGLGAGTTDVMIAVAPRVDYENNARDTAIRSIDLVNATGVAQLDRGLGSQCQVFRADRIPSADFLWTVDTSGSMTDDQERLGRTATQFFTRLSAAGVDFRVGVITAGSTTLNLDSPGFTWINGTDAGGALALCRQVTVGTCPTGGAESLRPYAMGGSGEEPTAAAVIAHNLFTRRGMMGETNPNRRFRAGARVVTFHVTDEPGSNDFSRYFDMTTDPQNGRAWGTTYNAASLGNIIDYFRRNSILTFGLVPRSTTPCSNNAVADLPRCVIEGNGGAVIPINTATDAEIAVAMMRIVEAIAGASSQFVLERTPITSTIKVRVRGMDVPRSRAEGFDYDAASRAIVFYGTRFRPNVGDEVVASYRVWQPCPTAGATCRSDAECCAPNTCMMGRCTPPCAPTGSTCTTNGDCCAPNVCTDGTCQPAPMCVPRDGACTPSELGDNCCPPFVCVAGRCGECLATDSTCSRNAECCSGVCTGGRCVCRPTGGRCTSPIDCCSRYCVDGQCGPG
ncbi:MAG: hypothetical protein R3A52_25120 [Polyangiales bacterium]